MSPELCSQPGALAFSFQGRMASFNNPGGLERMEADVRAVPEVGRARWAIEQTRHLMQPDLATAPAQHRPRTTKASAPAGLSAR